MTERGSFCVHLFFNVNVIIIYSRENSVIYLQKMIDSITCLRKVGLNHWIKR